MDGAYSQNIPDRFLSMPDPATSPVCPSPGTAPGARIDANVLGGSEVHPRPKNRLALAYVPWVPALAAILAGVLDHESDPPPHHPARIARAVAERFSVPSPSKKSPPSHEIAPAGLYSILMEVSEIIEKVEVMLPGAGSV